MIILHGAIYGRGSSPDPLRLAAGGTIVDAQIPRRNPWPVRAMRLVLRSFWIIWWATLAIAICVSATSL